MITTNQYLDQYPISPDSEKLIVGTIHPHNHEKFSIPFFYGNLASIWILLSEAFPDELKQPLNLESILSFLQARKISVSDTIRKCERKKPTALDNDLIPIELNTQMLEDIRNSNISEIFFTSGYGKNNAFKLFFVDILGQKITPEIRKNRQVLLNEGFFGRSVKLIILYSPSGSANIALSTSKIYLDNIHNYQNSARPVYDFKIDYFREQFGT